jgi:hypothetical protein
MDGGPCLVPLLSLGCTSAAACHGPLIGGFRIHLLAVRVLVAASRCYASSLSGTRVCTRALDELAKSVRAHLISGDSQRFRVERGSGRGGTHWQQLHGRDPRPRRSCLKSKEVQLSYAQHTQMVCRCNREGHGPVKRARRSIPPDVYLCGCGGIVVAQVWQKLGRLLFGDGAGARGLSRRQYQLLTGSQTRTRPSSKLQSSLPEDYFTGVIQG